MEKVDPLEIVKEEIMRELPCLRDVLVIYSRVEMENMMEK